MLSVTSREGASQVFAVLPPPEINGDGRDEVVALEGVVKEYAGSSAVRALDGVNLTVHEGEFIAIVGPSGSGKSTLLNLIGALDVPTAGTVRIAGHDIARLRDPALSALRNRHIGFVFQQFNLIEGLTAVENVAVGLMYAGQPRRRRLARARRALERVGLEHRMDRRPGKLSGGERQRVAIARAIVGEPSLVLADEPTGNLDSANSKEIIALLKLSDQRYHQTLIVVTHDRDIALQADRIITFGDGRIVGDEGVRA